MALKDRLLDIAKYKRLTIAEFERQAGLSNGYIKNFKGSIGSNKIEYILSSFPELNPSWLLTGEGEMLKQDALESPLINYADGVPYYDEFFECGFSELTNSTVVNPDFLVRMPGYDRATLWCKASGASMEPEISNGDRVAMQLVQDPSFLPFGDIYGIITTTGMRTIKRLGKSSMPGHYRLIPTNPDYDEQDIPVSIIAIVYRVLGSLKTF